MPPRLEFRYLSGHDVDRLAIGPDLILDATERALAAQGRREVVLEPREHLVPDPAFDGHFNLLRAYVAPLDVAGVKVVGDYHGNYKLGLPSELALLTLYDPRTGVPRAIIDATAITEWRTGAVTALGGRHLARSGAKVLGHVERRHVSAEDVEVAVERRVGHQVLAGFEHDLAPPLGGERLLRRVEDQVGPDRQGVDVVARQVADLEAGHGSQGDSLGYQPGQVPWGRDRGSELERAPVPGSPL